MIRRARAGPVRADTRMIPGNISIRMIWAFARVLGDFRAELAFLKERGVDEAVLADPDGRISHTLASELLQASALRVKDPALGLHAGEKTEAADWGTMHYLGRNCADFRGILECCARYIGLIDELVDAAVVEEGPRAIWRISYKIPRTPIANDFQAAAMLGTFARALGRDDPPLEVHLTHAAATDAREYERVFRAPVRLGTEHNEIVFSRELLDHPIVSANPDLFEPFNRQAQRLLDSISRVENTSAKVQRLVLERLGAGDVGMQEIGRSLHMSASTLRRRLSEEGTTYQDLVDQMRRDLALRHIENPRLAVTEIAFLLGFSTVGAFGTAFKRWSGATALEYRARARAARH